MVILGRVLQEYMKSMQIIILSEQGYKYSYPLISNGKNMRKTIFWDSTISRGVNYMEMLSQAQTSVVAHYFSGEYSWEFYR